MANVTNSMLAIDPGVELGWAYWPRGAGKAPEFSGVITPPKAYEWQQRMADLQSTLHHRILLYRPSVIICEWPGLHESSEAGMKSARTGSLIKLAAAVGVVMGLAFLEESLFVPVPVGEWKGQMSKPAVIHRIRRILGDAACTSIKTHAWDAVGIGLHHRGHFK